MRRLALLLLGATLLALFLPLLVRDHVVYPHDNALEVGRSVPEDGGPAYRRLNDASHFYVPVLHQHLQGNTRGWLSTWDPHTELGRPTFQLFGLGKAFLPTHVFAWFSDDALRVYTWSALTAVALTCLFGFLLLEALGLHPLAALTGALGIGIGNLVFSSLCFTLFLWGPCWETALFWGVTTFVRRPSLARGLLLAFFTHALLLSAYPQSIVWLVYPLAGYAVLCLVRSDLSPRPALALGAKLATAVLLGAASALPVYLDVLVNARLGTRLEFEPRFFAEILPDLGTLAAKGTFVATLLDGFSFGNPWVQEYPFKSGPFLLPLWAGLAVAGLALGDLRRLWPVHAFVLAALLMTVWEDAYLVAVRTLGLGLSRTLPVRMAHLPLMVLGAMAADRILRGTFTARRRALLWIAVACGLVVAGVLVAELPVGRGDALFAAVIALGLAAFLFARKGWILVGLALVSALVYGPRLLVTRAHDGIHFDSPLVELVRRETAGGARFAWVGSGRIDALTPNQEALFGLCSIHSYNPLFSRRFQEWAGRYRKAQIPGPDRRRFLGVTFADRFLQESAATSAATILLSKVELPSAFVPLLRSAEVSVYRSGVEPLFELQTEHWQRTGPDDARIDVGDGGATGLAVTRVSVQDERLVFRVSPVERETLLFVSQQVHPGWRAHADGRPLATLAVNDVFQGVLLPPGTAEVELEFRAFARWSWIPQALFVLAALLLCSRRRR